MDNMNKSELLEKCKELGITKCSSKNKSQLRGLRPPMTPLHDHFNCGGLRGAMPPNVGYTAAFLIVSHLLSSLINQHNSC